VTLTSAASVDAQVRFGLGGGPTFSLEEGGGTDFHAMGTLGFGGAEGRPLAFRIDGMYQFGDAANLIIGTANVVYNFSVSEDTRFQPYLVGGGGVYNIDPDFGDGATDFGVNGGAGFQVPIGQGTTRLFGEARFHAIFTEGSSTNILPITVGVMFGGS
jgi:hypothetical protein